MERIKALRDKLNNEELSDDEIRAYCIQIETILPEPTRTLYIDADGLIYYAAYSPTTKPKAMSGSFISSNKISNDDDLLKSFNSIVDGVVEACELEATKGNMIRFKDYILVYTPSKTFRNDLSIDYKSSRKEKKESKELKRLKQLVKPKGLIVDNVEADDIVAYFARRGNPIASGDKDVIYGVAGNNFFYHPKHRKVVKTSKEDADKFVLYQTIAGDSSDDIQGIKGLGLTIKDGKPHGKSVNLNPKNFDDVVKIYENHFICLSCKNVLHTSKIKGLEITLEAAKNITKKSQFYGKCSKCKGNIFRPLYTKEDALLARRLVGMDQFRGLRRNKIVLYKG